MGGNYRYSFNGMEKDDEVKGSGNSYTTKFRQYDPRLGRWLTIDPLASSMSWQSPYYSMDNSSIMYNDVLGDSTDYGITNAGRIYQIGETNNTNVEFATISFKDGNSSLGTQHIHDNSLSFNTLAKGRYKIDDVTSWMHNHPNEASHKNQYAYPPLSPKKDKLEICT